MAAGQLDSNDWTMATEELALPRTRVASPARPVAAARSSGRLTSIDALRGVAALAVVVHHAVNAGVTPPASATWYPVLSELADFGRMGVPLFFVLSGFCIHFGWSQRKAQGDDAPVPFLPFWRRRLWRLYPPYLVALTLSMALVVVIWLLRPEMGAVAQYPEPRLAWIGGDYLAHAFMLHGVLPIFDRAGGNPPLWTLAREEYFYLLYFGLLAVRRRVGVFGATAGVVALGLVFPLLFRPFLAEDSAWWDVINSSAIVLWAQWCLGLVSVEAYHGNITLPAFTRDLRLVPVWGALAIAVTPVAPVALAPLAWGMTFFTLLNAVVARERAGRWSQGRLARWFSVVGVYSYSIYLVHHPVRGVVKYLLESWIAAGDVVTFVAANTVVVLAGYGVGRLFFQLVERRFVTVRAGTGR